MIRGTWFGVTKTGRFAFITNVREAKIIPNGLSRGFLVSDFLISSDSPFVYLQKLSRLSDKYTGFNLVVGDLLMDPRGGGGVWYYGNKSHEGVIQLQPGLVYGISNGNALVTGGEWWKVKTGVISVENAINNWKLCDVTSRNRCSNNIEAVQDLQEMLEDSNREEEQQQTQQFNTGAASTGRMNELVESLLDILRDKSSPDTPPSTPQTPLERFLAPICIDQHNGYGTRTHTVLCIDEFWNAKMTEVDRYTLQDGVVWTGRESRIVSESIVETGIDFSEQRRDFAFRIEAAPGDVEDDVVKQQRNVIVSETDDDDNEI
ncbi:NRDE protein-domain-containing protein [Obelidium mucronatum]|nr:NRDE protein-domain-containing protein [Obelidium mucronatum]